MDNKNNMSYSMVADNNYFKNNEFGRCNFLLVQERGIHSWVKNNSVTNCYDCKKKFWFYLRKHHCRACGRIYCCYCTEKYVELPNDIEKFPSEPGYWAKSIENMLLWKDCVKQRVCEKCYNRLCEIKRVQKLIQMFKMIDTDLLDLYNFIKVCQSWKDASIHILSKFREIQYKLPSQELTKKEKQELWINKEYLIGHSRWMLQLIKSIDYSNTEQVNTLANLLKKNKKITNCIHTMCTRCCNSQLSAEDALELLRIDIDINNDIIKEYITNSFADIDEEEFICYIPYITFYLYKQPNLVQIMLDRSVKSNKIRVRFYWAIIVQAQYDRKGCDFLQFYDKIKKKLLTHIKKELGEEEAIKLGSTIKMIECFNNIKSAYANNTLGIEYDIIDIADKKITSLINPDIEYDGINIKGIIKKDSATNPIIIPLYYYKDGKKITNKVMYKNENLLKDQIVVNIIALIDIILKKEENMDLDIVKYDVIPTSKTSGIVEMVDDSVTIYDILEKKQSSIQNFIIEHNKEKPICEIRNKFIRSTAAYCIISYILGIGDRHLDNIMIHKSGALFHIDYGYILGHDPKYSSQSIRVTPDILDAMGGANSKDYETFQKLCSQIYNCLRRHVGLFMNLLMMLTEIDDNITKERLENEIINRFEPGENTVEAKLHLVNQMNNSRHTYEHKLIDFMHRTVKENSVVSQINSIFNRT